MLRKLLKVAGGVLLVALLGLVGLYAYARTVVDGTHDLPAPDIRRATTPAAIARGEVLVRTACAGCHADPVTGRLTGTRLDFPAFFGEFHAANITADRQAGIGAVSDALVARVIRVGIRRDGHLAAMPRLPALSDDDVAAILGFLRSPSPDVAPAPPRQPPPRYALAGTIISAFLFPPYPEGARRGIAMPPKGPGSAYGRYLANNVLDCFECHTEGFGRGKLDKPGLYGGRLFPGEDAMGHKTFAPNLTPHRTGLGAWTFDDFARALRTGITPDGRVLQPPMTRMRLLDDVDVAALWAYLRTVPPVDHAGPAAPVRQRAETPEQQFVRLGCAGCHAAGQHFAANIAGCVGKPLPDVARWIRRPQEIKPDTQMPTYESLLDDQAATALAAWVQVAAGRGPIRLRPSAQ